MKKLISMILGICVLTPLTGMATVLPLSSNSWDNPQFVNRFLGTYGVDSKKEPQITEEESTILQEVIDAARAENYTGSLAIVMESGIKADNSHSPAFDFIAGNLNFQLGNLDAAVVNYKAAIERFPEFRRAYENLGRLSLQQGDYDAAVEYITAAMELGSTSSDLYGLLGFCYLNAGHPLSALDAYRLASALDPDNKDWKVGKAQALLMTEQFASAAALFRELLEEDPANDRYLTALSNCHLGLGDHVSSSRILEILRRMGKADGNALRLLGDIYLNENMPDLALGPYLEARTASKPLNLETQVKIAGILAARDGTEQAEELVERIEADASEMDDALKLDFLLVKASLAQSGGDLDTAAEILEDILKLDPVYGPGLLQLGRMNYDKGEFEESIFYFERATAIKSIEGEALIALARAHVAMRNYTDAARYLRRSVALNPNENVRNYLDAVVRAGERQNF
ncbi:MAG: tetratricopeptide repeat protein [Puniceicoccaceae bacterium]